MQMICDRDHHKHCACESCLKGHCDSTFHAAKNLSSVRLENWDQCGRIHHDTRAGIANLGFEGLPNQTGMYWFAKTKATCRTGLHKWNVVVAFKRTEWMHWSLGYHSLRNTVDSVLLSPQPSRLPAQTAWLLHIKYRLEQAKDMIHMIQQTDLSQNRVPPNFDGSS